MTTRPHIVTDSEPRLRLVLCARDAHEVLRHAWFGGKNLDNPHARWAQPHDDAEPWVIVDMPLDWIRSNEAGDLYDGTVNPTRAREYARTPHIDTPVQLAFGPRAVRHGHTAALVIDGGHRTSAARMRGDTTLPAILRQRDFDLLITVRASNFTATPPTRALPSAYLREPSHDRDAP